MADVQTVRSNTTFSCLTCRRIRKKRCPGIPSNFIGRGSCIECDRLSIECVGAETERPPWYKDKRKLKRCRDEIKSFLSSKRRRRFDCNQEVLVITPLLATDPISPSANSMAPSGVNDRFVSSGLSHGTFDSVYPQPSPDEGHISLGTASRTYPLESAYSNSVISLDSPVDLLSTFTEAGPVPEALDSPPPVLHDAHWWRWESSLVQPGTGAIDGRLETSSRTDGGTMGFLDIGKAVVDHNAPPNLALSLCVYLLATCLPQVRSLVFVVDEVDAAAINDSIEALRHVSMDSSRLRVETRSLHAVEARSDGNDQSPTSNLLTGLNHDNVALD
ncbi:uncharacterized protein EI90DRAFT_3091066 [Cantharellus anzutake]|uniref:uncharacterized protein n=1 Tax=Cantharellus anzutake TaxID=1750568 RepID=UPI001902DD82|nr:uncharacterized protein EI90DRAFT_3091066 [Cantharellus anzutake]KAF8313956.1 hypothetical protein EI90DRAFT_3091066 [Cantharellus anzutake]